MHTYHVTFKFRDSSFKFLEVYLVRCKIIVHTRPEMTQMINIYLKKAVLITILKAE